jgi:4,5-dihydroxyphthalate decarboxylase
MRAAQQTPLSVGTGYHLRARALWDGRVRMNNFALQAISFASDGMRHERFLSGEFDAAEFSLANYLALKSRNEPLMAIPVFPNRKFRQGYVFVQKDSPLRQFSDLKGKKVGIPQWLNTCGLWVRGILSDEYDIKVQDIHWIAYRGETVDITLPPGTHLEKVSVPGEGALSNRLLKGEFDALILPDYPPGAGVRRLLPDAKTVEMDFFRRKQIFPTSHAVVFRQSYLDQYPAAASELFLAWCDAKRLALEDDRDATFSNLAWVRQAWEEQQGILGPDPWRYGIKGNETVLHTLIRYAREQGLLKRSLTIAELFLPFDEPQE